MRGALLAAAALLASSAIGRRVDTTSAIKQGAINVHLICHSHDDVGWLKTPEGYYQGSNTIGILPSPYYAQGAVQFIIKTVVAALQENPDRRFTVVEQYFFRRWYMEQDADMQAAVQALVAGGQLVFANGGLVMHDEAAPSYIDMVDNTQAGTRFITETFGEAASPTVTSQLDPFGHSAAQVSLLSTPSSGYMATFHARMDYEEVAMRHVTQTMDFAWAPSPSLGLSAVTMGGLGYFGYSAPPNFCFDMSIECQATSLDETYGNPVNTGDAPDAEDVNVALYAQLVLNTVQQQSAAYPTDPDGTQHLPWTMGDDFNYQSAQQYFQSLDRLIALVNANSSMHGINLLYSTQATYAQARIGMQTPLTLKTNDGFPYADSPHSVWSGYFTSRPALKGFVRESSSVFQAAKQLQAWAAPPADLSPSNPLWLLETAMGVAQHHDAVSGTSKQQVAFDYAKRLQTGRDTASSAMSAWVNGIMGVPRGGASVAWTTCDLANATICSVTEAVTAGANATIALLLHTPQSQAAAGKPVRVPVPLGAGSASWAVLGPDGVTPVSAQLVPASPADAALRTTYYGVPAPAAMAWLWFFPPVDASRGWVGVPAAGYATVFLQPVAQVELAPSTFVTAVQDVQLAAAGSAASGKALRKRRSGKASSSAAAAAAAAPSITNGVTTLTFDPSTGVLSGYATTAPGGVQGTLPISQGLLAYRSSTGDLNASQPSGAYIFRPADSSEAASPIATSANLSLACGPIVCEARQTFTQWATQVFRVFATPASAGANPLATSAAFAVEYTLGPLPTPGFLGSGTELVSRFSLPSWNTSGTWFTDSNGREMQQRVRNSRPDYPLTVTEFAAQNFYPVNAQIAMRSAGTTGAVLSISTDRTVGGASLADGQLELMLHRRIGMDDARGVFEALNEPGVNGQGLIVRSTHVVQLAAGVTSASLAAQKAALQDSLLPLVPRLAPLPAGATPAAWAAGRNTTGSLLRAPLPANVHLVTAHAWSPTALLVRLAHLVAAGEDPSGALSSNATVSLASLFPPSVLTIVAATEMTLPANRPLASVPPTTYKIAGVSASELLAALPEEEEAARRAAVVTDSLSLQQGRHPVDHRAHAKELARGQEPMPLPEGLAVQEVTLPLLPPAPAGPSLTVTLAPMQIRTFLCTVQRPA